MLVAGIGEIDDPADIPVVEPALGTLLATLEATGTGFDRALPPGESLEPDIVEVSQARGPVDPDGPISLTASFSSIKPDTYQLRNFGQTFTVDVGEGWWIQPNSAGFLVLSSPRNGGPGDRDMRFVTGVADVVPVAAGPVAVGDPRPLTTADDVIGALGTNLEVTGVEEVDLGGAAATRFDVRIPDGVACSQDDPCEYVFRTRSSVILQLWAAYHHRIWWLEGGTEGPSMILAMAPDGDGFVDRATELLATVRFNDS